MFFYRAWAGLNELNRPTDPFNDQLYSQFLFHRWGYAALLAITLVASLVLNSGFVLAFVGNPVGGGYASVQKKGRCPLVLFL